MSVLTMFIGCIFVTQTIIAMVATHSATSNLPYGVIVHAKGAVDSLTAWAIVGQLTTVAWGLVLLAVAKPLAAWMPAD